MFDRFDRLLPLVRQYAQSFDAAVPIGECCFVDVQCDLRCLDLNVMLEERMALSKNLSVHMMY
jgi:ubiquitin C-terminal hydrolase